MPSTRWRMPSSAQQQGSAEPSRAVTVLSILAAVIGVDADVMVRKIASPDGGRCAAASEFDADEMSSFLITRCRPPRCTTPRGHRPRPRARRRARTTRAPDRGRRGRVADRADNSAQVGVRREERGLDQRRVRDGERDAPALGGVPCRLDPDVMNLVAPSPSRTMACASSMATAATPRAAARAADRGLGRLAPSARVRWRRARSCRWSTCRRRSVAQLKEGSAISRVIVARSSAGDRRIGGENAAWSPCPGGSCRRPCDAGHRDGDFVDRDSPRRALRQRVGGHDRRHRRNQPSSARASRAAATPRRSCRPAAAP